MSAPTTVAPGYIAGAWKISPSNSEVRFTVRHLGVTKVHGRFKDIAGTIVTGDVLERSSATARIAAASVDTGFPARDGYLRGGDVLAADEHNELQFTSTGVRTVEGSLLVDGELTIRNVTRPLTLAVEVGGFADDPIDSVQVLGLSATATLRRSDFGFGAEVPTLIVGEEITMQLDIHAVRDV
jgi:polyisoprenoid-binding protein YceI